MLIYGYTILLLISGWFSSVFAVSAFANLSSLTDIQTQANCTFEANLCNWAQSRDDEFDWTRNTGQTPSDNTGPDADHTTGTSGYYMFIETSAPRRTNELAILVSPLINTLNSNYLCFSMWYYAYGANIGHLEIRLEQSQFVNRSETLWTNKFQGSTWNQATASIKPTGPFQILIVGTVGDGYLGDIAIDDITIESGLCSSSSTGVQPGSSLVG